LERCETLDSRSCENPNPNNSFPVGKLYTVHAEVMEGKKDLWTGSDFDSDSRGNLKRLSRRGNEIDPVSRRSDERDPTG
jgi:hypothetical protein